MTLGYVLGKGQTENRRARTEGVPGCSVTVFVSFPPPGLTNHELLLDGISR
jgi:hypothetical protein